MSKPFFVKDCTLAVIATGESSSSLIGFRDIIERIPVGSLYTHFWGARLHSSFVHPEYHNDFAHWAHHCLHDYILSERLGNIDPTEYGDLEDLRRALIDIVEERLDEIDLMLWSTKQNKFHFLRSIIIIFDTMITINFPQELKAVIPSLPLSSIFYHFIDARRRTEAGNDDFSVWLSSQGDNFGELLKKLMHVDPYFLSLKELRQKLSDIMHEYFP